MWVIKWKDIVVAKQCEENIIRLDKLLAPFQLFGNMNSVDMMDFFSWIETRVIQDSRLDLPELLKSLNLEEYKVYDIALKTKAILTGVDHYSIEWIKE